MYNLKKQQLGALAENLALNYLIDKKCKLLAKNFSCKFGEIDLIMQLGDTIIFIEVRCKAVNSLYTPLESINTAKIIKIKKTADMFLVNNNKFADNLCRFDVISVDHNALKDNFNIVWITDAFN
jgi:putative endonuclease